jgi:hypothetical protein
MKWTHIAILQIIIILSVSALLYQHADKIKVIKTPPKTLSKWYKPENKRQVWLHNMFKLRREMQAINLYSASKKDKHLNNWMNKLRDHYLSIGEMVPRWKNKLDVNTLNELQSIISNKRYLEIKPSLNKLQKSCDSCHESFQVITALLYRTPDFSSLKVRVSSNVPISFESHMNALSRHVNQIKIFSDDNMPNQALSSLNTLTLGMEQLGNTCIECHKKGSKMYPNNETKRILNDLTVSLQLGHKKEQGRHLGNLAVTACATCHGTHKLVYSAKELMSSDVDMMKLLKH